MLEMFEERKLSGRNFDYWKLNIDYFLCVGMFSKGTESAWIEAQDSGMKMCGALMSSYSLELGHLCSAYVQCVGMGQFVRGRVW